ncbi:GPP34 family phosphoprotein [Citricoccus sp. SGAir0253]|uniref:GOLPH3/VPS74 family protein n=1 Tax=Citricoccus sp. SGAir0253 TaxID=2567881 RepID=UPI0010CD2C6B|nr:GPP34 family phosphoprotein [Citricoccus sp. SGAir0253]QCU78665.1 GPP34 family phosphoprotein [Citricoccus sp. SGAir0253]
MLIVEETFLLLTKDHGPTERVGAYRRHGLVTALLADLEEAGVVRIGDEADPKVTVVRGGATGRPVLDEALPALDGLSGTRLGKVLGAKALDPGTAVGRSLAAQGIVQEVPHRFGAPDFVVVNPAPEIALRRRLGEVLSGRRTATTADATELGILKALNLAYRLLAPGRGEFDRSTLDRTLVPVVQDRPLVAALQRAVPPVTASTTVAVTAPGAAGVAERH